MPNINRIRIVNFSYNHDSRHIIDETFNFHGGEDALLNLSNGGGKSVLVQLFLQVIVPGAKIQGRNIAGFFRKKSLPAYIMIEWKLDGGGGYLLTGTGITSAENAEQEGGRPRVRYFTFTSKYNGANAFDIVNIPVVKRNEGVLEIKPFREARRILAEKEKKDPYLVGYYPDDDGDGYARRLAEFGIAQDEWRNIIARINDSENGLEDLFQKYKSSSQLLDEWIIKTVEKVMFKGRSEQRQLEEMLHSLVQEVVENERFIIEKQLFTGFLQSLQEILTELEALLKNLEEQKKLGASLAALHAYLSKEINNQREKQQANEEAIDAARLEEKRVDLEERSNQYQIRLKEQQIAGEKLNNAEKSVKAIDEQLNQAERQAKVWEAARLAGEIRQILSDLSGIAEKLAMAREDYDKDDRTKRLEYTLKIRFKELLNSLEAELITLRTEQAEILSRLNQAKDEQVQLEAQKSSLDSDKGRLEERLRSFNEQETQIQKQLGCQWGRNLLGELDTAEMEQIRTSLQEAQKQLLLNRDKLLKEKTALTQVQQELDKKWKDTQAARAENLKLLDAYEQDRDKYLHQEEEIKKILDRYEFDSSLLFDREHLSLLFTKYIIELENKGQAAARTRNESEKALVSIKNGYLHTSQEMASILAELDIQFDTGESYLRNLSTEIRQAMLAANPILPYAFIMSRADIERIAQTGLNMILHRVIPLIAYEDLNLEVENQGGIAQLREEISVACLYEGRIFDNENLNKLIMEMGKKRQEAAEHCEHYSEAHRKALLDHEACRRFDYAADYYYQLEKTISAGQKRCLDLEQQLNAIEEEKTNAIRRQDELNEEIRNLEGQLPQAQAALDAFQEFMEREPDYQSCRSKLNQINQNLVDLKQKKELLNQSIEKMQDDISSGKNQITMRADKKQKTEQKYLLYKNAPPAEEMTGSTEELEKMLTAIKGEYNQDIEQLDQRRQELDTQNRKIQKQLDKLGLAEEEYCSTLFDETEADSIQEQIVRLKSALKMKQEEKETASRAEAAAAMAVSNAMDEVLKLGAEAPLPLQEIKGDFAGRRSRLRKQVHKLEEMNKDIAQNLFRCRRTRENIEQVVDISSTEADSAFVPEQDFMTQASQWEKGFRHLQNENSKHIDLIRKHYTDCKVDYRDKNINLDSIFKGLDPLWDKAQTEFDDFFYLYERMSQQGDKLTDLITIYVNQLANLERNKQDMVQQSFLQGRRMYEEIGLISENSKVRLPGRSRRVQMLKIDLQLDNQESARQRIAEYIDECINKVREKTREENRNDELRKTVARLMSSRELLNVYLGNAHIPIHVFKIDINMQNSRLKVWEDAVRENSGGEKFVIFFSLLSALMAYTRARTMEAVGADPDSATRVLIMDNPFGPISSEHLLQPMFEIAKRYRTQLICLSDLKQNSIMNCFNLIYMLKVRTSAVGGDEYLKFEEYIRDADALHNDEKLEKAVFRVSDFKEMPLFGDDE